jgi:hypothetical protein
MVSSIQVFHKSILISNPVKFLGTKFHENPFTGFRLEDNGHIFATIYCEHVRNKVKRKQSLNYNNITHVAA